MANNSAEEEGGANSRSSLDSEAGTAGWLFATATLSGIAGSATYLITITLLLYSGLPIPARETAAHASLAEFTYYLCGVFLFLVIAGISALAFLVVKDSRREEGRGGSSDNPKIARGVVVFGGVLGVLIGLWVMFS